MSEILITRQQIVECLEGDWKNYVASFGRLAPEQQTAMLSQQGYTSFHDLLAHICGWWEECIAIVDSILKNEEQPKREYDIDAFNAESMARFQTWKEDELIGHFENLRNELIDLTSDLPDGTLENSRIAAWIDACVINHFHEHRF
jgi:hypothetical protein